MMTFVFLWLLFSLVEVYSQTIPYVSFMGNVLPSHSYIDMSLVGRTESTSVHCNTDLETCCSRDQGPHRGDWYPPNSEERLPFSNPIEPIFEQRSDQKVEIRKNFHDTSVVSGIYRCEIETIAVHSNDTREMLFVGLYDTGGIYCRYIKSQ